MIDTNVLVYRTLALPGEEAKQEAARQLMAGTEFGLSVQVLQEFYVQATRPTRPNAITHGAALEIVEPLLDRPVQTITPTVFRAAIRTKDRFQISYWDAAIIEAARALGCVTVLSEDLGDGQDYDGIQVLNPFRGLP